MVADKLNQVAIRMIEQPPLYSKEPMNNPEAAIHVMRDFLQEMDRELVCIVNLQSDLRPINMNIVSVGALNQSLTHPREVMKSAILSNAAGMMIIHNHPSGNLNPSKDDISVTDRLRQAGELLGISLYDHIIVGRGKEYFSFHERRILKDTSMHYTDNIDELQIPRMVAESEQVSDQTSEYVSDTSSSVTNALPLPGKDMDSILKSLKVGVEQLFTSDRYKDYLKTMSKFHNYSFNNTLLIAMQRPDASLVTGYKNWQSMGRQVKKGEKGITIIAPAPVKKKCDMEVLDQNQNPVLGTDGKPKTEEVEITLPFFKAITVFDIAQTTGDSIELLTPKELQDAVKEYELFMRAITQISPVPIRFDEISSGAKGFYHNVDKEIVIQQGMSESQTIKTAIHEFGHARLHDKDLMKNRGEEKDRLTKEVEAESVAYCVCSALGLDTSEYSFPYIAGWSSGKNMKELKASMDIIRQTAGEMIDELNDKIRELLEERQTEILDHYDPDYFDILEETGCINFYVVECSEIPVIGESHYDLTLTEAFEAYDKIPDNRMYGIKEIGFNLKDGSDWEGLFPLVTGEKIDKELINSIPGFRENRYVQEAITRAEKILEDRKREREPLAGYQKKSEQQEKKNKSRGEAVEL